LNEGWDLQRSIDKKQVNVKRFKEKAGSKTACDIYASKGADLTGARSNQYFTPPKRDQSGWLASGIKTLRRIEDPNSRSIGSQHFSCGARRRAVSRCCPVKAVNGLDYDILSSSLRRPRGREVLGADIFPRLRVPLAGEG
jgi:hypothetical protein